MRTKTSDKNAIDLLAIAKDIEERLDRLNTAIDHDVGLDYETHPEGGVHQEVSMVVSPSVSDDDLAEYFDFDAYLMDLWEGPCFVSLVRPDFHLVRQRYGQRAQEAVAASPPPESARVLVVWETDSREIGLDLHLVTPELRERIKETRRAMIGKKSTGVKLKPPTNRASSSAAKTSKKGASRGKSR